MTLEHIPKALSPQGTIPSAPKDFAVYVSALSRPEGGVGHSGRVLQGMANKPHTWLWDALGGLFLP